MAKKEENIIPIEMLVAQYCASQLRVLKNSPEKFDEKEIRKTLNRVSENITRTMSSIQRYKKEGSVDNTILSALEKYEKGESAPIAYKQIFSPKI